MAPALDQKLGTAQPTGAATTTVLSPSAALVVAANARIVVWASLFGAETPASCASSPALTWVRDLLVDDANSTTGAVFSAAAPTGWTPGTITVTHSASASVRGIAADSFTGVAGGSSGYLNGTPGFTNEFGTTDWVTPNITTTGDALLFAALYADGATSASATVTTSGATELEDVWDSSGTTAEILTAYKVVSANGTYSIGGNFGAAPGEQKYAIVGYAGAVATAAAAPPTFDPIPFIPQGRNL